MNWVPACVLSRFSGVWLQPYGLPASSVQGIAQARIPEWVALPSSRGSSPPRDGSHTSLRLLYWQAGSFTTSATWEARCRVGDNKRNSLGPCLWGVYRRGKKRPLNKSGQGYGFSSGHVWMDVRVGLWRKPSAKKLMLLNCGVEESWESLGLQGDPTSPS